MCCSPRGTQRKGAGVAQLHQLQIGRPEGPEWHKLSGRHLFAAWLGLYDAVVFSSAALRSVVEQIMTTCHRTYKVDRSLNHCISN